MAKLKLIVSVSISHNLNACYFHSCTLCYKFYVFQFDWVCEVLVPFVLPLLISLDFLIVGNNYYIYYTKTTVIERSEKYAQRNSTTQFVPFIYASSKFFQHFDERFFLVNRIALRK